MNFWALSGLINGTASFIFGGFVYLKNPRKPANKIWFIFSLTLSVWAFNYFFWQMAVTPSAAIFWCRMLMTGAIFIPVTFLNFIIVWLDIYDSKKKTLKFCYILSILFFILDFTPYFVSSVHPALWFDFWPQAGPLFFPFLVFWVWLSVYCWYILFKAIIISSPARRNQIIYIFLGAIIGFTGGFTNYPLWYGIKIPPFGNMLASLYVAFMAYAIIKHHLMDIRIALTRTGVFLCVYLIALGLPLFLGYKYNVWKISAYSAVVLSFVGSFVYSYFRRRAESILLKEQMRYQTALKDFSSKLIFIRDADELLEKLVSRITELVNIKFCAIYLSEGAKFCLKNKKSHEKLSLPDEIAVNDKFLSAFKDNNIPMLEEDLPELKGLKVGIVAPLFSKQKLCGIIVLGQKINNVMFTDADIDVFSIVANQVSLALSEIYYFNEYRKVIEEKFSILIEKEKLESAFQISEAYRHELGNIINIISMALGNITFMDGYEPSKAEIEQTAKSISANVKRAQYVFDVINLYNEHSVSEFKKVDLSEVLSSMIKEYESEGRSFGIDIRSRIKENIFFTINKNFEFALKYLLEGAIGAIRYTLPEEKIIEIVLKEEEKEIRLVISDTGGNAAENKFYKGVGIVRAKDGGICYFLARRIIFDHSGTFKVKPCYNGKGTEFFIELPVKTE